MKIKVSSRHQKLLKVYEDLQVLALGQRNREYLNYIQECTQRVLVELRAEQRKLGMIPCAEQLPASQKA